jgi:hypothetical protein
MWPFPKKSRSPGVEQHPNGQISFALTDEEEAEVNRVFQMMKDSRQETEQGTRYIHPDAHKAMTAWALIGYAQAQVTLAEMADKGVVDKDLCFRKALAAASKAYSLHSLPIYMFDMGCIFEMLGDTASAQGAFRSFLESQRTFQPSDVDRIALGQRDVEAAVREAHERISHKDTESRAMHPAAEQFIADLEIEAARCEKHAEDWERTAEKYSQTDLQRFIDWARKKAAEARSLVDSIRNDPTLK